MKNSKKMTTQSLGNTKVSVIIPALNEEKAIGYVLSTLPDFIHQVIVVDNGSTDNTALIASNAGAVVISEPVRGYGRACVAGMKAATAADIIVFMDADAADNPEDMESLIKPILDNSSDMVIGSRLAGTVEKGALTLPQSFGNWLACKLMCILWDAPYTDLGPFRALRRSGLMALNMDALTYGWTVQMQVRALKAGLRVTERPVSYAKRIGKSKISGTVRGVVLAGSYILSVIFIEAMRDRHSPFKIDSLQGELLPNKSDLKG